MSSGDSNGDGLVGFTDFIQLANNFGFRYAASSDFDELIEVVLETRRGDANLDTRVNFADFVLLAENFGQEGGWSSGDSNGDRVVDFKDFVWLADNYGFRNDP